MSINPIDYDPLSSNLIKEIQKGNAILFLGAGASLEAESTDKKYKGITGNQLRDKLSDRFLDGDCKDRPLSFVADIALSEVNKKGVYEFIESLIKPLQATEAHKKIPLFKWKAIITTNYDLLIEDGYEKCKEPMQKIRRVLSDKDELTQILSQENVVPLLKLHGCISKLDDDEVPLILSDADFNDYEVNRGSLYKTFIEWADESPIIFCGYSLTDHNIQKILFDATKIRNKRPRCVIVNPTINKKEERYWNSNRVDCFHGGFHEFMDYLHKKISHQNILLGSLLSQKGTSSIKHLIPSHREESPTLREYIDNELIYIHRGIPSKKITAFDFYRGNSTGFGWIDANYDIKRSVNDTLLEDIVLSAEKNALKRPWFYILKGYAGSGKSVAIKRFAWEASSYDVPVFYLEDGAILRVAHVEELCNLVESRIFIVIDDVLKQKQEVLQLLEVARNRNLKITIIATARTNEWNVHADRLESESSNSQYDLLDLQNQEISELIQKLKENNNLGYLKGLEDEERFTYFKRVLKSQLLVTLYQATTGKKFEEIIVDEYEKIVPREAQLLYLDICTLDRFGILVRAGLIARISGIPYTEFSERFINPLEHIIQVIYDRRIRDYSYKSRHSDIAQIIFDRYFDTAEKKVEQIIKIVRFLNTSYETDKKALVELISGENLAKEFSDKQLAYRIYDVCVESGFSLSLVNHQRAIFEMRYAKPNLKQALNLILSIDQDNRSNHDVKNTWANILRRLANNSNNILEKESYRKQALSILKNTNKEKNDPVSFYLQIDTLLDNFKELVNQNSQQENTDRIIEDTTNQIESALADSLNRFPDNERLLNLESSFSDLIKDSPRAINALNSAYKKNPDSIYTLIRLARYYFSTDKKDEAISMIKKAAMNYPTNKVINFEYAKMLRRINENEYKEIIREHLLRSFSKGDANYDAQWCYARHEFLYGQKSVAKETFKALSESNLPAEMRNRVRGEIRDELGNIKIFSGSIKVKRDSFGFIESLEYPDGIFIHFSSMKKIEEWSGLKEGDRIQFSIAFNFKGAIAREVALKGVN